MTRKSVSAAAEQHLEAWLDQLMQGQLHISELPLCVAAWFHAGEAYGRAARQPEINQLERECNRLGYYAFTTPQDRQLHIERRLSQALDTADETVWTRLEADLREMRNQSTRTGVTPPPIESDTRSQIGPTHGRTAREAA